MVFAGKIKNPVLFDYGLFDKIYDKTKNLISEKSEITDIINHNFGRTRLDSFSFLPIQKILTFYDMIILIKPIDQLIIRINMSTTLMLFRMGIFGLPMDAGGGGGAQKPPTPFLKSVTYILQK